MYLLMYACHFHNFMPCRFQKIHLWFVEACCSKLTHMYLLFVWLFLLCRTPQCTSTSKTLWPFFHMRHSFDVFFSVYVFVFYFTYLYFFVCLCCKLKRCVFVCVLRCRGSYYGSQCEIDGEVLGVAVGASVAAILIIVLTLIFLCMWRWVLESSVCQSQKESVS